MTLQFEQVLSKSEIPMFAIGYYNFGNKKKIMFLVQAVIYYFIYSDTI